LVGNQFKIRRCSALAFNARRNGELTGAKVYCTRMNPKCLLFMIFMRKLPYDLLTNFAPVILCTRVPNVLSVHPSVPLVPDPRSHAHIRDHASCNCCYKAIHNKPESFLPPLSYC
jgi:hypothetical protein